MLAFMASRNARETTELVGRGDVSLITSAPLHTLNILVVPENRMGTLRLLRSPTECQLDTQDPHCGIHRLWPHLKGDPSEASPLRLHRLRLYFEPAV